MTALPRRFVRFALLAVTLSLASSSTPAFAQAPIASSPAAPVRLVVGTLANDSAPDDLDFQGAECIVDTSGGAMTCAFQQVFLTRAPFDPQTCLVTTNSFERRFEKNGERAWTSRGEPEGPCGVVDVATLTDDGGQVRWTLEYRKTATQRDGAACRAADPPVEQYSWKNARRRLPCQFVQPGAVR